MISSPLYCYDTGWCWSCTSKRDSANRFHDYCFGIIGDIDCLWCSKHRLRRKSPKASISSSGRVDLCTISGWTCEQTDYWWVKPGTEGCYTTDACCEKKDWCWWALSHSYSIVNDSKCCSSATSSTIMSSATSPDVVLDIILRLWGIAKFGKYLSTENSTSKLVALCSSFFIYRLISWTPNSG